jgi:tubby-related protein 1
MWADLDALVCAAEDDIIIQFGKVGDNSYTLDFASPVSAFQAFAISLTAFEG